MSRPKYKDDQAQAKNRIIDAFWEYLQETYFEKMNVKEIVIRSRVNKNTFYYHFACIEDLAYTAIDGVLLKEVGKALLYANMDADIHFEDVFSGISAERLHRISLLLSDHATALNGIVIKKLIEIWSAYIKVNDETDDIFLLMSFIAGGIVTTLRGKQPEEFLESLKHLFNMSGIRMCIYDMQRKSLN
jgi:Transcriptional regulator